MKKLYTYILVILNLLWVSLGSALSQKIIPQNLKLTERIHKNNVVLHALKNITANNDIDKVGVVYISGESIVLNPGFYVSGSANFLAKIEEGPLSVENVVSDSSEITIINYPNPFTESTFIEFVLPQRIKVSLFILNDKGIEVKRLIKNETLAEGKHIIKFGFKELVPGMYTCILNSDRDRLVRKVLKH